ncbi:MAG: hypothetical protein RJA44_1993 [Pseudomonadota bacterium]
MTAAFDPSQKFIRVVERRADGMVEFEFAVGEPELFVEMLLPQAAFEDFCRTQGVSPDEPQPGASPAQHEDFAWTLHDAMAWSSRHRL